MDVYAKYKKSRGDQTADADYPREYYPDDLKACPFCGNVCARKTEDGRINLKSVRVESKYLSEDIHKLNPETVYFVMCRSCFGRSGNAASIRGAVQAWNSRN